MTRKNKTDYHIIFHHCSLELCTDKLLTNLHSVQKDAKQRHKKPHQILFDKAIHTTSKYVAQIEKNGRGRPDILHTSLLNIVYSPLFTEEKNLSIHIHTLRNRYFYIPNDWRVPVNYRRFYFLMEHFLKKKRLQYGKKKIVLETKNIEELLERIPAKKIVSLTPQSSSPVKELKLATPTIFLIGGFNKGIHSIKKPHIKAFLDYRKTFPAWRVAGKLTCLIEENLISFNEI